MKLNNKEITNAIFTNIFLAEVDSTINIFLCGANIKNQKSIRKTIYKNIKDYPEYNIIFPESLFSRLLSKKMFNLHLLEQELASFVDIIIMPLEGCGSMAELGAFTLNEKLLDKIVVINSIEHKNDDSFINLGPLKLLISKNKKNLIYYNEKVPCYLDSIKVDIKKYLKTIKRVESKINIKNIFNLSRFLFYMIAIFQPISKINIKTIVLDYENNINEHYIDPALEILFDKELIKSSHKASNLIVYSLSKKGHDTIYEEILPRLDIIKAFSEIRTDILNSRLRKKNKLNLEEERKKFLE